MENIVLLFVIFNQIMLRILDIIHVVGLLEKKLVKNNEFLQKNQNLKTTEEKLESLLEYEELWDIKNGRTLCKDCHKLTDTYGGRANNIKWPDLQQIFVQSKKQDDGNCKKFK